MATTAAGSSSSTASRVIVFDFDQTISTHHVFKCLAGYIRKGHGNFLAPPYALSERGQIRKCFDADKEMKGRFFPFCLGSEQRVAQLDKAFGDLRQRGCQLFVCSKGLVAPIRLILETTNLLHHFSEVYGRIEDYEVENNDYDDEAATLTFPPGIERHIGRRECAEWSRKAELCHRLAGARPCVLVEDDRDEISKAKKAQLGTCFVEKRQGVGEKEISDLLAWAEQGQK
ncbi:unnamed protein product [Amoebophrya sp. A25]|nr:unnamed protein product [Amoebophrya sp. A25]|eukprot:GSA25T00013675001.1